MEKQPTIELAQTRHDRACPVCAGFFRLFDKETTLCVDCWRATVLVTWAVQKAMRDEKAKAA